MSQKNQTIKKAVIPVAGLGTRFLPITKTIPKELLPIVDKPVIHYIVEEMAASGITQIIFIISENKSAIESYFNRDSALECILQEKNKTPELHTVQHLTQLGEFIFVHQPEPLGLGHAVLQAKEIVGDEPFLVVSGDDIVESNMPAAKQLIEVYNQYQSSVLGVYAVPPQNIHRYGIIDPAETLSNDLVRAKDIIEKPQPAGAPSTLGVGGRWLLTPEIFSHLENTKPGADSEIQLTDAIRSLMQEQHVYAKTYNGIYRDCGNKLEYIKTVISFAQHHPEIGAEITEYIKILNQ